MRSGSSGSMILLIPPIMWACNAILGRAAADMIPPMLFNFFRWLLVFLFLLPLAPWVLQRGSGLLTHWRRYIVLGFLSIFSYNSLQYLALHTSTAINVTLIAASMPVWMLVAGRLMYGQKMGKRDLIGAALSILGVAVVLAQGDLRNLSTFQFLPGDIYIVLATMGWAVYSWMLKHTTEPKQIRQDWAAMLLAQVFYGLIFSALFSAGEMWLSPQRIQWSWSLVGILLFVSLGPALLAYRTWGEGVARVGPTLAGFYANLTPPLAAVLSSLLLGEYPKLYHGISFVLIVLGIWLSAQGPKQ